MQIKELAHSLHVVDHIASTLHEAWGDLSPWSDLHEIRTRLIAGAMAAPFPHTVVAMTDHNTWAATGSVKLYELPNHPDKIHWLGEIFVLPQYRGLGLGSRITAALTDYAFNHGAPRLFLYTPDQQALYARLGWQEVSCEIVNNEMSSIMMLARR